MFLFNIHICCCLINGQQIPQITVSDSQAYSDLLHHNFRASKAFYFMGFESKVVAMYRSHVHFMDSYGLKYFLYQNAKKLTTVYITQVAT